MSKASGKFIINYSMLRVNKGRYSFILAGELTAVFGDEPIKLVYGMTDRPDRPLEVERVPKGELL